MQFRTRSALSLAIPIVLASCSSLTGLNADAGSSTETPAEVPLTLKFERSKYDCVVETPCTVIAPVLGGGPANFSIVPGPPAGMSFDTMRGILAGTPVHAMPETIFIITAFNADKSATATLSITVQEAVKRAVNVTEVKSAPMHLKYSTAPLTFKLGETIAPITPSQHGGKASSFSVSPALPAGLELESASGVIRGTPTRLVSSTDFTITATNSEGSASATVSIVVLDIAPSNLQYDLNPAVYDKNKEIIPNAPKNSGGAPTNFSVTPALPEGLTLDAVTGILSGSARDTSPAQNYTVSAFNASGKTSTSLSIAVQEMAPRGLSYLNSSATYHVGSTIAVNTPSSNGGPIQSYEISPPLPAGLSLDEVTGSISGIPTAEGTRSTHTVTAKSTTGSTSVDITVEIREPVSGLYFDGILILAASDSTTYDRDLHVLDGSHSIRIIGSGDFTFSEKFTGPGTVTITTDAGNTVFLKSPQENGGVDIASGTLDVTALRWATNMITRSGSGIIKRCATPPELSSELRAWFDASKAETIFSDELRTEPQTTPGGVVKGWTNLANPSLSASSRRAPSKLSNKKDAIVLGESSFGMENLNLNNQATVIAVVKSLHLYGSLPSIFSGDEIGRDAERESSVMLGVDPLSRVGKPNIVAGNLLGSWILSEPHHFEYGTKQMFGATWGADGIFLQLDGSTVGKNTTPVHPFVKTKYYKIGERWNAIDYWSGEYYELVVTSDTSDFEKLSGYVAWHNNIQDRLPEEHKYKDAPPVIVLTKDGSAIR